MGVFRCQGITIILYSTGVGGIAWNVLMLVGTAVLLSIGLVLFVATVTLFGRIGKGTLAPWNPPQHLVVGYRPVPPCPQSDDLGRLVSSFFPKPCSSVRFRC